VIHVVVGDLAREQVDAVVRPADAALAPIGAAAVRLDEVGGATFAAQRRTATALEAGAAVVTGAGALPADFVLHVVVVDERGTAGPEKIRQALVSAWQRARDWGLMRVAAPPLIGAADGSLAAERSAALLVETFAEAHGPAGTGELRIVVDAPAERDMVDAIVRRQM
jgi:O-acetyl-ADP-ribose deacetylase (regulator of RNase III)